MEAAVSSVAHAAIGQLLGVDMVVLDQFAALRELIHRRQPVHVENLAARTDIICGFPVAIEAPLHEERVGLPHERHLLHLAVAGRTANSFVHMNTVIKKNKVRQVMHAIPMHGRVGGQTLPHRCQDGLVGVKL